MNDMWIQIWSMKAPHIVAFTILLVLISLTLLLKDRITRKRGIADLIRYPLLLLSFLYVGLYLKAQPTSVNVAIFFNNLFEISFPLFNLYMLDPFLFLSFIFISITMILWGRGAFCGWLCPYGAMLELLNRVYNKMPFSKRIEVPYSVHRKLIYVKYGVFALILSVSFLSFPLAEYIAEVEPFKTFVLKLSRDWYFVFYFFLLTGGSVFVYRAFCRYLCPLGAVIALPSLLLGRWIPIFKIKRYELCRKCIICYSRCNLQAIRRDGTIDRKECLLCLECHENFWDEELCPVLLRKKRGRTRFSEVFLVSLLLMIFSVPSFGKVITVGEGGLKSVREALREAEDGDIVLVKGGVYEENILVEKRVHLKGEGEPVLLWEGTDNPFIPSERGFIIGIKAEGVRVEGFVLRHKVSGKKRTLGIVVWKAKDVVIRNNRITGTSIGVKGVESPRLTISNNVIEGEREIANENERGNCIDLTGSNEFIITDNVIRYCKDGIYLEVSHRGKIERNLIEHSRYGIHAMWVDGGIWRENVAKENLLGLAIMYTKRAVIERCVAVGNRTHGLLLIQAERSTIKDNVVIGNSCGIYFFGSYKTRLTGNLIMNHLMGIWSLAASTENVIEGNSFINNGMQVRFISTKKEEIWKGNYWSDYLGWDMNGDGVGDIPYESGSYVDYILWRYPLSKFLFTSPVLHVLTFLEKQFPVFEASKIVDPSPLMSPHHKDWRELAQRYRYRPSLYYADLEKFQVVH